MDKNKKKILGNAVATSSDEKEYDRVLQLNTPASYYKALYMLKNTTIVPRAGVFSGEGKRVVNKDISVQELYRYVISTEWLINSLLIFATKFFAKGAFPVRGEPEGEKWTMHDYYLIIVGTLEFDSSKATDECILVEEDSLNIANNLRHMSDLKNMKDCPNLNIGFTLDEWLNHIDATANLKKSRASVNDYKRTLNELRDAMAKFYKKNPEPITEVNSGILTQLDIGSSDISSSCYLHRFTLLVKDYANRFQLWKHCVGLPSSLTI